MAQENKNAIDNFNELAEAGAKFGANAYKWGKRGVKVARTAGVAISTVGSGAWIPFAIAGVVVLIIFLLVLVNGSGEGLGSASSDDSPGVLLPPGGGLPGTGSFASCPVANGTISTPSYQQDNFNGHCSDNYGACDHDSRRAKSIDVSGSSQAVLPMIEGNSVKWAFVNQVGLQIGDCSNPGPTGCGKEFVFVNYLDGDRNWTLFVGHIGFTGMVMGQAYDSGTIIGGSATDHFHFSIGKDLSDPTSFPAGSSDTRPGWLAADVDAGMCVKSSNTASNTCTQQYEGTGPCTPQNLMPYFGNDSTKALVASIVCNCESGSNPLTVNDNCSTNDYSVGLFQINAVAHCPGAYANLSCNNLISESVRDACVSELKSPSRNISEAVGISGGGASWTQWGVWLNANSKCPGVINVLTKCGIKY